MRLAGAPAALAFALLAAAGPAAGAAPLTSNRYSATDYVNMIDACSRLGLRFSFSGTGKTMTVRGNGHTGALLPPGDNSHREMLFDGARIYLGDPLVNEGGRIYISRRDFDRRLLPLFRPDLVGGAPHRPRSIMLDPGHGGIDPGTTNPRFRLQEKTVTLDVALRLRALLTAQGWQVFMTRTADTDARGAKAAQKSYLKGPAAEEDKRLDLIDRALLARERHVDVFLSIHFDAGPTPSARGSMILTFPPAGQRSSKAWGGANDAQGAMPGNRFDAWNTILANAVFNGLPRRLATYDAGERLQNISVLRNDTGCPAALVEPAYITNDAEAQRLMTPTFREQVAEALAAGLRDYAQLIGSLAPRTAPH